MGYYESFVKKHPWQNVMVGETKGKCLVGGNSKTALLLFPGSGQDAMSCFDLISAFEKKYKVIAVNYDGFYSVDSFFKFVEKILEKEKVMSVYLYGLSLGGFLVQHFVRRSGGRVKKLIISHAAMIKSKTIIKKVIIPGKIMYFFLPLLPQSLLNKFFIPVAGRVQSGNKDYMKLYKKYSSKINLEKRLEFARKTTFSMLDKNYIKSVYKLGTDMQKLEKNFTPQDLLDWKGKILIIRTDNDPLAQDDGEFKKYYPNAKVVTFHKTGHLTPFIQFEKMAKEMDGFLRK